MKKHTHLSKLVKKKRLDLNDFFNLNSLNISLADIDSQVQMNTCVLFCEQSDEATLETEFSLFFIFSYLNH